MFVVPELALQLLQGRGGDRGGLEVVHAVRLLQGEVVTLHKQQHSLTLHVTLPSWHYWLLFTVGTPLPVTVGTGTMTDNEVDG